jgi:hypothetical protein
MLIIPHYILSPVSSLSMKFMLHRVEILFWIFPGGAEENTEVEILFWNFPGGAEENTEDLSQDIQSLGRELNRGFLENEEGVHTAWY